MSEFGVENRILGGVEANRVRKATAEQEGFNVVNVTADMTPEMLEILSNIRDILESQLRILELIHDDVHIDALGGAKSGFRVSHPR